MHERHACMPSHKNIQCSKWNNKFSEWTKKKNVVACCFLMCIYAFGWQIQILKTENWTKTGSKRRWRKSYCKCFLVFTIFVCLFHLLDKYAGCLYTFVVVVDVFCFVKKMKQIASTSLTFFDDFFVLFFKPKKTLIQEFDATKKTMRKKENFKKKNEKPHYETVKNMTKRKTIITAKLNEWINERTKFFCYIPFNFDLPLVIHIWMDQCKKQQ